MEHALLDLSALFLTLASIFGYINHIWIKLPHTIGILVITLLFSLSVIAIDLMVPSLNLGGIVSGIKYNINFSDTLMTGLLSFLLFAGALHVDLEYLAKQKWTIGTMASVGVILSTLIIGYFTYLLFNFLGIQIPLEYCLVFGALISPTDPIAVLGIMKTVDAPKSLEAKISGESLFNDGVGIVVFTILAAIAISSGNETSLSTTSIIHLFVREAIGGIILGLVTGFISYRAIKLINEYNLEILITLALVTLTYSIALNLHVSGPIAVVVAGIMIGNQGKKFAMSKTTSDHLFKFWSLIDEVLNSVLFLMIGFELIGISFTKPILLAVIFSIPIMLIARLTSISLPILIFYQPRNFIPLLTWGGLRGGISVALALSLPDSPEKNFILAMTYGVVIFSIVFQGLTFRPLLRQIIK